MSVPAAEPNPTAVPVPEVTEPAGGAFDLSADVDAAIRAANAEATTSSAPPAQDAPTGGPPAGDAPPGEPAAEPSAAPEPGGDQTATSPSDDEPDPTIPKLTRKEKRTLFEEVSARDAEIARLKQTADAKAAEETQARQGLDAYFGTDTDYGAAEQAYDEIVRRNERGEYITEDLLAAARSFTTWRTNRRFGGTLRQMANRGAWDSIDEQFRSTRIDGVNVSAVCDEVTRKGGSVPDVLATVAETVKAQTESAWQAKFDTATRELKGKLDAEVAAHGATRAKFGLGRAATAESGGSAASKADVVGMLIGSGDIDDFVRRAERGEFAGVNLQE